MSWKFNTFDTSCYSLVNLIYLRIHSPNIEDEFMDTNGTKIESSKLDLC